MGREIQRATASRQAPHRRYTAPDAPAVDPSAEARPRWSGLYRGEPEACRRALWPFLRTMALLGVLLEVFQVYRVEGQAFLSLSLIAAAALPFHYLAPLRFKKPIFLAASVLGLYWVWDWQATLAIAALAALLIGACRLPIRWGARAAILAALGLAMAWLRGPSESSAVPSYVWTWLGSMFMFRIIIYMYELKHSKGRESWIDAANYFVLLPNYCFLHFPVVDYRTLQRGYFAEDVHALHRRGLVMMLRGTLHLLAYRLVDQQLLIGQEEVRGPASLAGFLVCNYLTYLQVSGQFHMACGMLHLFGYKLPETHHLYMLATGFTDYWRRINIYWKDFMVRVFFNPVVFRLKRWPQPLALAAATVVVFVATWLLHAYQKFWLRGTWGFSVTDALFWGILGALVLVNVQLDLRRTRRAPARKKGSAGARASRLGPAVRGLKVAGTFVTIVLLWSLWSSPSLSAWLEMLRRGLEIS